MIEKSNPILTYYNYGNSTIDINCILFYFLNIYLKYFSYINS